MNKKNIYLGLLLASLMLSACGDESGTNSVEDSSSSGIANIGDIVADADYVVDVYGDLPKCNENKVGQTGFVSAVSKQYVCEDGEWVLETSGVAGNSSNNNGSSSSGNNSPSPNSSSTGEYTDNEQSGTDGILVDERDGQTYKTVKIGDQVWMAKNLNYEFEGSVCPKNEQSNCDVYGRLYTWKSAQDVCPEGWHLPSRDEIEKLLDVVDSAIDSVVKYKKQHLEALVDSIERPERHLKDYSWGEGFDTFGFSALPAGSYHSGDQVPFGNFGYSAWFWSSTENDSSSYEGAYYEEEAYYLLIGGSAEVDDWSKATYLSVRCIQGVNSSSSSSSLTDARDGQVYKTVTIGTQTWMAENLNYKSANSYVNSSHPEYGRYYIWSAAMDSAGVFTTEGKGCGDAVECKVTKTAKVRGVCPTGWHLPSRDECMTLLLYAVGGAHTKLKSTNGWDSNGNGSDAFGFSALPAGYYASPRKEFELLGSYASFWCSTEDGISKAYRLLIDGRNVDVDGGYAGVGSSGKTLGYSVRCLQD